MHNCPFDAEVWATVSVLGHDEYKDKPFSKLFLFDPPEDKPDEMAGMIVAKERGLTVVSSRGFEGVTEVYPQNAISKKFHSTFFMNDLSYMIALALYNGYKHLLLWGVDQSGPAMYVRARVYVTHWLGVATGYGVKWEMAPDSLLWRKDGVPDNGNS